MVFKTVRLLVVVSVALCLVPAGAHFFELANKMSLLPFFGIPIFIALFLTLLHTFMARADRTSYLLSLTAFLCLAATQVIFWMFTYPMNAVMARIQEFIAARAGS
jgi:hypothetical protein